MKKYLFLLATICLISAGCNKFQRNNTPTNDSMKSDSASGTQSTGLNQPSPTDKCNNNFHSSQSDTSSLTTEYFNSSYCYSIGFSSEYKIFQINNSESGEPLPNTPATSNSQEISLAKSNGASITILVTSGDFPLTEANIKKGYAVMPIITVTQIAGLPAYKVAWEAKEKIPYYAYYVETLNKNLFYIKISSVEASTSEDILKSLRFY